MILNIIGWFTKQTIFSIFVHRIKFSQMKDVFPARLRSIRKMHGLSLRENVFAQQGNIKYVRFYKFLNLICCLVCRKKIFLNIKEYYTELYINL